MLSGQRGSCLSSGLLGGPSRVIDMSRAALPRLFVWLAYRERKIAFRGQARPSKDGRFLFHRPTRARSCRMYGALSSSKGAGHASTRLGRQRALFHRRCKWNAS